MGVNTERIGWMDGSSGARMIRSRLEGRERRGAGRIHFFMVREERRRMKNEERGREGRVKEEKSRSEGTLTEKRRACEALSVTRQL
jgi:hypothetical protein